MGVDRADRAEGQASLFGRAAEMADRYIGLMTETPKFNRHAAGEMLDLIRDLDVIVEMQRDHEATFQSQMMASGGLLVPEVDRTVRKIKILTRTFYYCAGRIRAVLRDADLPHLGVPRKRPTVWRVRDDMLEHYKSDPNAINSGGFSFGGPEGPSLSKNSAQGLIESGKLSENAKEFAAVLERHLAAALAAVTEGHRADGRAAEPA